MARLELLVNVVTKGQRDLDGLSSRMQNVGRNLSFGVTLPLVAAGSAFTTMAADAEKSQAKLESVFDSTGAAAWTSIDALNEHARALAESTTFDDDAVAEAQAALLQFGTIAGEQFTGATDAAADLAAFMETDIASAAETLGRALANPEAGMARLARAGIILTDEQKNAIQAMVDAGDTAGAQQLILDAVSDRIGSVAEDLAETSGGQMAQAMNQLGEAGEAIGVFLLPVLSTLAGFLSGLASAFTSLDPSIQGFIVTLAAVVAAVGPVLLIGAKLVSAFGIVKGAFSALSAALTANPYVLLIGATIALVGLIIANWDKIKAALANAWKTITEGIAAVGDFIAGVWEGILDVFGSAVKSIAGIGKRIWEPVGKGFAAAIDFIKGVWNSFARWWNSIEIAVPSIDIPFVGKVGGFSIGLPDLPMLASGGIVNQPTLALIGERGPEAVIPLDRAGGMGTEVNVTVMGNVKADDEDSLADAIGRVLWVNGLTDRVLTGTY